MLHSNTTLSRRGSFPAIGGLLGGLALVATGGGCGDEGTETPTVDKTTSPANDGSPKTEAPQKEQILARAAAMVFNPYALSDVHLRVHDLRMGRDKVDVLLPVGITPTDKNMAKIPFAVSLPSMDLGTLLGIYYGNISKQESKNSVTAVVHPAVNMGIERTLKFLGPGKFTPREAEAAFKQGFTTPEGKRFGFLYPELVAGSYLKPDGTLKEEFAATLPEIAQGQIITPARIGDVVFQSLVSRTILDSKTKARENFQDWLKIIDKEIDREAVSERAKALVETAPKSGLTLDQVYAIQLNFEVSSRLFGDTCLSSRILGREAGAGLAAPLITRMADMGVTVSAKHGMVAIEPNVYRNEPPPRIAKPPRGPVMLSEFTQPTAPGPDDKVTYTLPLDVGAIDVTFDPKTGSGSVSGAMKPIFVPATPEHRMYLVRGPE